MNGYIAFWKGKQTEINANTSYEAQGKAMVFFGKLAHPWDISIVLAEKDGQPVIHSTSSL
jgi:hypothetical protein